ncbi:hypothetical protein NEJ42_06315, partial [Staphylococcus aureus]|nr:hypothetical protein [Staphylococcus aureus]
GFIDINKAPFKVFIFSMSTLKGAFHISPFWFIFLFFFYKKYKTNAEKLAYEQRQNDSGHFRYDNQ